MIMILKYWALSQVLLLWIFQTVDGELPIKAFENM